MTERLTARDDLSSEEFAALLNSNLNNTDNLNRAYSLLNDTWSSPINEAIELASWESVSGSNVRFADTTNSYTLTFNTEGGTSVASITATSGTIIDLSEYKSSMEGYTFDGWYSKEGNQVTSVTLTEDTTVYAKFVENTVHKPYINGYEDGKFRPDNSLTRAETAQLLYNITSKIDSDTSFSDVSQGSWYYDAVTSLTASGIIQGYKDGTFRPDNSITRSEFVALMVRYAALMEGGTINYSDVASDHWAAGYIGAATQAGYIQGYPNGTFKPDDSISRAEAVTVLNSVLKREVDKESLKDITLPFSDVPDTHWAYFEILEAAVEHIHS